MFSTEPTRTITIRTGRSAKVRPHGKGTEKLQESFQVWKYGG